jgi:hypothetical protein
MTHIVITLSEYYLFIYVFTYVILNALRMYIYIYIYINTINTCMFVQMNVNRFF